MQSNSTPIPRPLVLAIIDGYGINPLPEGNAIMVANTPVMDALMREYPLAAIQAAGIEVGLPWGEMGNSETGHQNIGSGRVIYQSLPKISLAIEDGSFFQNEALLAAAAHVQKNPDAALHIMGLLSDGGVHSHIDHQFALLKLVAEQGLGKRTYIHAFLDGRDAPPDSAGNFVKQLMDAIGETGAGTLSTLVGRYYAMDRNTNWDRIEKAYNLLVRGDGQPFPSWEEALAFAFKNSDTKNFEVAPPMVIQKDGAPVRTIQDGDAVIFYNYRPDRAKQLTATFVDASFDAFPVEKFSNLKFVTMTEYDKNLPTSVVIPEEKIEYPLGRVFSENGLKQLRIAEGEKFAHVTYFFDGGRQQPFPGQENVKIPSIDTKDFSKSPEMSAQAITDRVIQEIQNNTYDVIVVNYANPDMVAHTGVLQATIEAVECVDKQIGRLADVVLGGGGGLMVTCDHGNAENVVNQLTHKRTTDHTNFPVPLIYASNAVRLSTPKDDATVQQILSNPIGVLADVAPTILEILDLKPSQEMTAVSLYSSLA